MDKITPRLVEHGHIVQELDFYKASLFRENPLEDVETLKKLCPNVRSLRMPYGCLTFAGVQHLIQFYGLKAGGPWMAKPGEGGQLHSLSLDMSKTEYQPSGMEWLTDLGKGLKRLELRINRRREGSTRQRTSFLQFEPLFEACQGLRELDIIPTPHFLPSSNEKFRLLTQGQQQNNVQTLHAQLVDSIHGAAPKFRTSDSLRYFETYKPPLRRLHLARVWFSDMDLEVLARACPEIDDLRLTNMKMDLDANEWNSRSVETPLEWEDRAKDELSIEVILKCWPGMRTLRLDGNVVRMFSAATRRTASAIFVAPTSSSSSSSISQTGSEAKATAEAEAGTTTKADSDMTASAANVTPASAGLLPKGSYKLASLCLYQTSLLEDDLVTLVDLLEPTLTYLNVDKNPKLTDQAIRHVLMTCSNLRDFSASELNLTMGVFEDYDPQTVEMQRVSEKIQGIDLEGESSESTPVPLSKEGVVEPATKKPWACIETLRSLDFSWRVMDGRPAHVASTRSSTVNINESLLPPYRHHTHHHRQQQRPYNAQGSSVSAEAAESTTVRMFRTPWHIESLYERLRALERLEVLQLEGWVIPWRAADIEAFLGHSPEPELVSKEDQFQEDKVSSYLPWDRYKDMGRWKEAVSLEEYVDADFAYVASQSAIVKEKLKFQGPSKDGSSWMASPGVGGLRVEGKDILPYPTSRMGRLKLLNIMCRRPVFLENPIGEASPFVLYPTLPPSRANKSRAGGADEKSPVGESSSDLTPSAILFPLSPDCTIAEGATPPPPPPPPPPHGFVPRTPRAIANNSSASTTVAPPTSTPSAPYSRPIPIPSPPRRDYRLTRALAQGVVASFMKACPQLERVLISTEGSLSTSYHLMDFTVQLGCSEESEAVVSDDEGKKGKVTILNDPAAATLRVSPRRVLCTTRGYPELTSLRRY